MICNAVFCFTFDQVTNLSLLDYLLRAAVVLTYPVNHRFEMRTRYVHCGNSDPLHDHSGKPPVG